MEHLSRFLCVVLCVLSSSVKATPWGMPGEAVIRSSNAGLLICMPKEALNHIKVDSIGVYEKSSRGGKRQPMWEIELKQNDSPVQIKLGGCVIYGSVPLGYQERVAPKSWTVGGTYYARINLVVVSPVRRSTLFYDAVFCVGQQFDGLFIYRQYVYGGDGSTIKATC